MRAGRRAWSDSRRCCGRAWRRNLGFGPEPIRRPGCCLRSIRRSDPMPAPKRSRKVVPLKSRGGGMTGRDGAIDFAAKAALANEAANAEEHIYRVIELVGTSEESIEDAINRAVSR